MTKYNPTIQRCIEGQWITLNAVGVFATATSRDELHEWFSQVKANGKHYATELVWNEKDMPVAAIAYCS
jgi:hypothetical protein